MKSDSIFNDEVNLLIEREMKKVRPVKSNHREAESAVIWLDDVYEDEVKKYKNKGEKV